MATVPTSGTSISFLRDIPFSNDYKHTRWFDSQLEQTTYFANKPVAHSMTQANYQRIEGRHYVAVNKHIDELWGTCYMRFQNSHYNNRWFYAFVTKLEYVNKVTTNVYFEIDVFQTWCFYMRFQPSFIVREHCPQYYSNGNPVVNTIDEGLDYGTEYEVVSAQKYRPYGDIQFLVIVSKETMHTTPKTIVGNMNGMPQGLSHYIVPFKMSNGQPPATVRIGLETGEVPVASAMDVLRACYVDEDAVNNIVSIYVTSYFGEDLLYNETNDTLTFPVMGYEPASLDSLIGSFIHVTNLPKYTAKRVTIGDKYAGFKTVNESKLLMHPYTVTVLDDFKGNIAEFKNEYIYHDTLDLIVKGSLGVSNKVSYGVYNYRYDSEQYPNEVSNDSALIDNNPSDVAIINDNLAAFLQGNRNTINNQKSQIVWNGVMGAVSNSIAGVASFPNAFGVASSAASMATGAGNTVLQLQGISAKQKDIDNVPAQLSKMGSNTAYDYGNNYDGVWIIKKQIKAEYRKKLEDFFKMFGYKVNEVKTPNFHTRQHWNYVQTKGCIVTGNFNNEDLQALKSVFDNGITLWHTDDIGNYALENGVL